MYGKPQGRKHDRLTHQGLAGQLSGLKNKMEKQAELAKTEEDKNIKAGIEAKKDEVRATFKKREPDTLAVPSPEAIQRAEYNEAFKEFIRDHGPFNGNQIQDLLLGKNTFTVGDRIRIDDALQFMAADRAQVDSEAKADFNSQHGRGRMKNCLNRAFKRWFNKKFPTPDAKKAVFRDLVNELRDIHERIEDEENKPIITPFMKGLTEQLQLALSDYYDELYRKKHPGVPPKKQVVEVEFYNCLGTTMDNYFYTDALFVINRPGEEPTFIMVDLTKNGQKIANRNLSDDTIILGLDQPGPEFKSDEESFLVSIYNKRTNPNLRRNHYVDAKRRLLEESLVGQIMDEIKVADRLDQPKCYPLFI
jgi:hypothetical protein